MFGASKLMDFELEMAFVVGRGNSMGQPIPVDKVLYVCRPVCIYIYDIYIYGKEMVE